MVVGGYSKYFKRNLQSGVLVLLSGIASGNHHINLASGADGNFATKCGDLFAGGGPLQFSHKYSFART